MHETGEKVYLGIIIFLTAGSFGLWQDNFYAGAFMFFVCVVVFTFMVDVADKIAPRRLDDGQE